MDDLRIDLAKKYYASSCIVSLQQNSQRLGDSNLNSVQKKCYTSNLQNKFTNIHTISTPELKSNSMQQELVQDIKKKLLRASFLETENLKLLQENKELNLNLEKNFLKSKQFEEERNIYNKYLQEILNEIKETKKIISLQNLTISLIRVDLTKLKNNLLT